MKTTAMKVLSAGVIAMALTGCEQHTDRPFVMSCRGINVTDAQSSRVSSNLEKYTGDYAYHAGGIPIPTPAEMAKRVSERRMLQNGYFGLQYLTSDEGRLPKTHVSQLPVANMIGFVGDWKGTGNLLNVQNSRGNVSTSVERPIGSVRVEHYYQDEDGELNPIHFNLVALNTMKDTTGNAGRNIRTTDVAALIPPDAKYAVYKMTWDFRQGENFEGTRTFTGWWAAPLVEEHRYRPNDYEKAQKNPSALGQYVYWLQAKRAEAWPSVDHSLPPEGRLGAAKGYSSVDCYARTGSPARTGRLVRPDYDVIKETAGLWVKKPSANGSRSAIYVGQERADLQHLPSDPYDWNGENHYIWRDEDPRKGDLFFQL